uniref:C2H2-type domain-containing protein n=1 Tax=Lepeophtheirus salmonis TaxID=72036 RepID=A0A0K2U1C4_LEPSM
MCSRSFTRTEDLKIHFEGPHKKKKKFHCSYCSSSFTQSGSLKNTLKSVRPF